MTTDRTEMLMLASSNGRPGDLRIRWDIPGYGQGHGEWFPPDARRMLMSHVDVMNQKYGGGTHRIETRA